MNFNNDNLNYSNTVKWDKVTEAKDNKINLAGILIHKNGVKYKVSVSCDKTELHEKASDKYENINKNVLKEFKELKNKSSEPKDSTSIYKDKKITPLQNDTFENATISEEKPFQISFKKISETEKSNKSIKFDSTEIVDWNEASSQIKEQVKEIWPKRATIFSKEATQGDRLICLIKDEKLVGCLSLEQTSIKDPKSLVDEIGDKKTYLLDIEIKAKFQGKGFGRELFNSACQSAIQEGKLIYLIDQTGQGQGANLYGGENTRQLFDVCFLFKGNRGEYLIKQKTEGENNLKYLEVDPNMKNYVFRVAIETPEGLTHLVKYLENHPADEKSIDEKFINDCTQSYNESSKFWGQEGSIKYKNACEKLIEICSLEKILINDEAQVDDDAEVDDDEDLKALTQPDQQGFLEGMFDDLDLDDRDKPDS